MQDLENDAIDGIIEKPKVKKEQTEKQKLAIQRMHEGRQKNRQNN
jgi:hypothetical protein